MNYDCVFRSYDCVFHDKIVLSVHRRVAMLPYIKGTFSQSYVNYHATDQVTKPDLRHFV